MKTAIKIALGSLSVVGVAAIVIPSIISCTSNSGSSLSGDKLTNQNSFTSSATSENSIPKNADGEDYFPWANVQYSSSQFETINQADATTSIEPYQHIGNPQFNWTKSDIVKTFISDFNNPQGSEYLSTLNTFIESTYAMIWSNTFNNGTSGTMVDVSPVVNQYTAAYMLDEFFNFTKPTLYYETNGEYATVNHTMNYGTGTDEYSYNDFYINDWSYDKSTGDWSFNLLFSNDLFQNVLLGAVSGSIHDSEDAQGGIGSNNINKLTPSELDQANNVLINYTDDLSFINSWNTDPSTFNAQDFFNTTLKNFTNNFAKNTTGFDASKFSILVYIPYQIEVLYDGSYYSFQRVFIAPGYNTMYGSVAII